MIDVTAIVVMRNEERYIGKCLDSVLLNDYPRDRFEIIVVDGASTDRSREIAVQRAATSVNITVLDNPREIVPTGLNIGVRHARGKYIVIMGAHCEYPRTYIRALVHELQETGADVVGASLATLPGASTYIARAIALATKHPFGVGNSGFRIGTGGRFVDTVPYGMYRRELFECVGLFREELVRNQDFEFNARVRSAGGLLYLTRTLQVVYYNVPTFAQFLRQGFTKGIWVARSWVCSSVSVCLRHTVPALFVLSLLLFTIAALLYPAFLKVLAGGIGFYFTLAIVSSIRSASTEGWQFAVLLPVLFFSYHVVYGLGSLVGLIIGAAKVHPAPPVFHSDDSPVGSPDRAMSV